MIIKNKTSPRQELWIVSFGERAPNLWAQAYSHGLPRPLVLVSFLLVKELRGLGLHVTDAASGIFAFFLNHQTVERVPAEQPCSWNRAVSELGDRKHTQSAGE